ncbi:glycosidase, partial [Candidatus Bathyarchaeota archaeon]|nr:glycosidase [Candidatus Bathyarchaeota archaeon]
MFEVICPEAAKKRKRKTVDIVKRLGVITPDKVHLKNYPIDNPATIFNPAILVEDDGDVKVYARIVLGYFTYASAVAELTMPLSDIYTLKVMGHYPADIVVYPSNRFDIWGVEDPRVYRLDDKLYMTYSGRTVNYFNPAIRVERTLPVTAVYEKTWRKICVVRLPNDLRRFVVSDK